MALPRAADQNSGLAIFYEVRDDSLPLYLDLGLDLRKLGEEARVPLDDFSLAHPSRKRLRQAMSRMRREDCRFELIPAAGVPPILDELEAISDRWLAAKHTREKRFSLGYFDRTHLLRLPVAVAEGIPHFIPEPKRPTGRDVTPAGKENV